MQRILITVFLLCGLVTGSPRQQGQLPFSRANIAISGGQPTVYITFDHAGERSPVHPSESHRGIWLRLHNNTHWAIRFPTDGLYVPPKVVPFTLGDGETALGLRDGLEVNLRHGVEQVDSYESHEEPGGRIVINRSVKLQEIPVGYNKGGDVYSEAWLPPGNSVVFSVPKEHLAKHLGVYITFNYEWECVGGDCNTAEPEHRVYFRASSLLASAAAN
jgi:hypothetical protein